MVNIAKLGDSAIKFTFTDNYRYLHNGEIEVPLNSLILVVDESDMVTFKKIDGDPFVSFLISDSNFESKETLIYFYKTSMVGGTGGGSESGITSGDVESMIETSLQDYYDIDEIDAALSGKADTSAVTEAINSAVSGKADTSAVTEAITAAVSGKQDTLIAGSGITISGNVISAEGGNNVIELTQAEYDALVTGGTVDPSVFYIITDAQEINISDYYTSAQTQSAITAATNALAEAIAEQHYQTSGDVQNAISGKADTSSVYTKSEVDTALSGKQDVSGMTAYTTSSDVESYVSGFTYDKTATDALLDDKFDASAFTSYSAATDARLSEDEEVTAAALNALNDELSAKQDTLVAGDNITISGNVISAEGGGGKSIEAGRGISITTGETADTVSFSLPISAGTGTNSIIEGNDTKASGTNSHAEGFNTAASGLYSHAEGASTKASGTNSHAEGYSTSATSEDAHSEGHQTKASGLYGSHAEGRYTIASGVASHTEGYYTEAKNNGEHASGRYNVSSSASTTFGDSGNTLFSVGNGTADNARHNAFEIRQNGDIYLTKDGQDVKLQDQLGGGSITIDPSLDSGSTNPVENRVIYDKFDEVEQVTAAALNALNDKFDGLRLKKLTQAEYEALVTKDNNTLYILVG